MKGLRAVYTQILHDHDGVALACERYGDGFFGQPANAVTSLAFVVAGVAVALQRRGPLSYAALVGGVGVGSLIQHGPHPDWQAHAHDLTLAAVLAYVAVDAASDVLGRELGPAWWLVPTAAIAPLVTIGPGPSSAGQIALATAAVGLSLWRARVRPRLRRTVLTALAVLGAGGLIGTIGERTSLCQPDSLFQGHAGWHVLAALALWFLASAITSREHRRPSSL